MNVIGMTKVNIEKHTSSFGTQAILLALLAVKVNCCLTRLDRSCKNISSLPIRTSTPLHHCILSLNLSHNKISIITNKSFIGLTGLEYLDLSYNNISKIDTKSFVGLLQLLHLYLAHNRIFVIGTETFSALKKL